MFSCLLVYSVPNYRRCYKEPQLLKLSPGEERGPSDPLVPTPMYLVICTTPGCRAQYMGYTTRRFTSRVFKHLNNGPMINHIKQENHEYKKIRFQILAQALTHETNKELWLKRHEYLWICRLGTLNKLGKKGLNKLIYDPIFHSNIDS